MSWQGSPPASLRALGCLIASLLAFALLAPRAHAALVASNGFVPEANGYSFQNFGDGYRGLTTREMRRLFGDRICSSIDDQDRCILSPEGRAWMESTNASTSDGHCFGMAGSAQLFFEGKGDYPSPSPFGAPTVPGLELEGNPKLQSYISYMFTLQFMPAVRAATTQTTPRGVVEQLEDELTPGNAKHLLTIYGAKGGHAVTPIGVDRVSETKSRIAVYDNNWPGDTRYVHVNTAKNTWSYQLFAGTTFSGTAKSKTMQLADPSAGLGHQPCFICEAKGKTSGPGRTVQLKMTGDPRSGRHGSVTVIDQRGRQTGCGPDGCFNRIEGAELIQPATGVAPWRTDTPPTIDLPTRNSYRVLLGSTSKKGGVEESIRAIGQGFSVGAEEIRIEKGETDQLKIGRRARSVSFVNDARGTETPKIVVTSSLLSGGRDYEVEIEPAGVDKGASIGARFNPETRRLRVSNPDGARVEKIGLIVSVFTPKGESQQPYVLKVRRGGSKSIRLDG